MAQRAIIDINGSVAPFDASLDKIRTPGIGAGSVTWVPDKDTRCTSLRVTANGTYNAAQRGDYGYDYVTVSVPGTSVTGRDPDTGEEVEVKVDPETGDIVKTVLPVEIRVTTPPTKTTYTDGETIDYSGIVVHAYSATGTDMGEVPFSELVFPVTIADAQQTDEWTDGAGLNAMMIAYTSKWYIDGLGREKIVYVGQVLGTNSRNEPSAYGSDYAPATMLMTRYNGINYGALVTGDDKTYMFSYGEDTDGDGKAYGWRLSGGSSVHPTKNAFTRLGFEDTLTNLPNSTVDPTTIDPTNLHVTQSLPVQWNRTGDGAVLETTFDIQVTPAGGDAA